MGTSELRGIYIHRHPQDLPCAKAEVIDKEQVSSSGISSATGSIASNNNYATIPRKRNVSPDVADNLSGSQFDEYEMEKIRRLMAHVDGDRRSSGSIVSSHRGSIDPSLMSSVFICVLILIFSISVYAFASLYRAVMKRMGSS